VVFCSNVAGQKEFFRWFFSAATVVLSMLCGDVSRLSCDILSSNVTERTRTANSQFATPFPAKVYANRQRTFGNRSPSSIFLSDLIGLVLVSPSTQSKPRANRQNYCRVLRNNIYNKGKCRKAFWFRGGGGVFVLRASAAKPGRLGFPA
jgi:hypothetical protein